jgi:rubrerythrin
MTVSARTKTGGPRLWRHRTGRAAHAATRPDGLAAPQSAPRALSELPATAAAAARRRREAQALQDNALYACECGYVFKAAVSTSVDCPNCGGAQAW